MVQYMPTRPVGTVLKAILFDGNVPLLLHSTRGCVRWRGGLGFRVDGWRASD